MGSPHTLMASPSPPPPPTLQWKTEILDYCPNTRVLLIGCKTDLRTDLSTLMELSHQKQAPISYEQVGLGWGWGGPMGWGVGLGCCTGLMKDWIAGLCGGPAAGSRELPGVLGLHLGEECP